MQNTVHIQYDLIEGTTPVELIFRDSAYHQGTVWPWLIGHYIDAYLKTYPGQKRNAHKVLNHFANILNQGCVGSISEIYDAENPFTHRGCISQAWSIAEVLRSFLKTLD